MTATIYCIVALVGDTQPVWLIDFDIVHHHVGDVFDVSVINPFVISWVKRNGLDFQCACHFHGSHVDLVIEWRRVRINYAVEILASAGSNQRANNFSEVRALEYAADIRSQQQYIAFSVSSRQLFERQTWYEVKLLAGIG